MISVFISSTAIFTWIDYTKLDEYKPQTFNFSKKALKSYALRLSHSIIAGYSMCNLIYRQYYIGSLIYNLHKGSLYLLF